MKFYATRNDAMQGEVLEALGPHICEHDVEAIGDAVLARCDLGYYCRVSVGEFWETAQLFAIA